MAALFPSSILFFLSLLVIFPLAIGRDNKARNSKCAESFKCGSVGIMSFPFSRSTEPNCGLCVVDCDTEPPKIKLSSIGEWDITAQRSNIITIQAAWVQTSCQSFDNLSLPNSAAISFAVFPNITLFKCNSSNQRANVHFPDYENYRGFEEHGFNVYYKKQDGRNPITVGTLPDGCSIIQLPIVYFNSSMQHPRELSGLLASEFYVEWHLSAECDHCHRGGGQCLTGIENQLLCYKDSGESNHKLGLIIGTVVSASGGVILTVIVFCLRRKCSYFYFKKHEFKHVETFLKNYGSLAPKRYHYSDVKKMTNSFKIRLGGGGYGSVYKGKLHDGSLVAVKILNDTKENGEEFINEVASISRTSHVNIIKLLGFCFEGKKRALVYEFMSNGSLEKFIYNEQSLVERQLGWQTLYKIAIGIARGLEYLHRGCNTQILHFDIKPHNILLDEEFSPKISDFGLSKLRTKKTSNVSMLGARGTIGYIAPEVVCRSFGGVSHKSDVYSYGMMILEMVGGRKNIDVGVAHTSQIYYPHWVYKQLELSQELGLDGIVNEEEDINARKMIIVSLWCIQTDPSTRPSITKVVEMLEGDLESLKIPPWPYLYSPPRLPADT